MQSWQYYPTGVHTGYKMACKLQRPITHICDPSAGKGHLIKHFQSGFVGLPEEMFEAFAQQLIAAGEISERFAQHKARNLGNLRGANISVIEIDVSHHPYLRELDCEVLGYDFLKVQSLATVSTLVMNPPFNVGAEHVLHAWNCLFDGEIVAIVNAQSIKNPNSKEKRKLVELIDEFGSVEFLQDEFTDFVERTANVEIALIHLDKKPQGLENMMDILSTLTRGDTTAREEDIDPSVTQALAIPSNFIENTVYNFNAAVDAARIVAEAEAIAEKTVNNLGPTLQEMQANGSGIDNRTISATSVRDRARRLFSERYKSIKEKAWSQIIRSTALTDKLSNQARKKVESQAKTIYQLEFTVANIQGFLFGLLQNLEEVYEVMICDMFDNICGRSNDNVMFYKSWKSNQKHKNLGIRIKRSRFILPRFKAHSSGALEYESTQFLGDLDKITAYLNNETGAFNGLVHAFESQKVEYGVRYATKYFDFRFFKGGTIHFFPKTAEVIEKLNRFVGKVRRWLPTDMEEGNADFRTQYDQAETFKEGYQMEFSKRSREAEHCLVYGLLQATEDRMPEYEHAISALSDAVSKVQDDLGIHAGQALAYQPQEQLLLIAA